MGRCTSKYSNSEKITLEEFISSIRNEPKPRRSTIAAFQQTAETFRFQEVDRAKIKNGLIRKNKLKVIILETCELSAQKIYADYIRYYDMRRAFCADNSYTDNYKSIIISQISLLNKNIKRFSWTLSTKYLITETIYASSISHYALSSKIQHAFMNSIVSSFKKSEKWAHHLEESDSIRIITKVFEFWKEYLSNHSIHSSSDLIHAKAQEGDFLESSMNINEVDLTIGLSILGFYDKEPMEEAHKLKATYKEIMKKVYENQKYSNYSILVGALGLLHLQEMQ